MTTNLNDVVVTGNADVTQLTVKANATQTKPLQSWQTSAGLDLAHVTSDGRLEIGNNLGVGAPLDAVVQVNQDITLPTSQPTSGWHSLGRLTGALGGLVNWVVHELLLQGAGGVVGLQTTLRAYLTHSNSGTSTSAELRAVDAKTTNTTGSSGFAVGQATGIRATVSNTPPVGGNAWLNKAVAVEAALSNDTGGNVSQATAFSVVPPTNAGTIGTLYGLQVPDLTQGGANYAIYTGQGPVHFGDNQELKVLASAPAGNPPSNFIKLYPKLAAGVPGLFAKDASGTEYSLSGSGTGDVSTAVLLAPTTSARNVVQPTVNAVPLSLKAASGQTADLLDFQTSSGLVNALVGADGHAQFGFTPAAPTFGAGNLITRVTPTAPAALWYWNSANSTWTDRSAQWNSGTEFAISNAVADEFYIGFPSKFSAIDWLIGPSTTGTKVRLQAWNGTTWDFVDETIAWNFANGAILFDNGVKNDVYAYLTWAAKAITEHASPPDNVSRYWLKVTSDTGTGFTLTKISIASNDAALVVYPGPYTTTQSMVVRQNGLQLNNAGWIDLHTSGAYNSSQSAQIVSSVLHSSYVGFGYSDNFPNDQSFLNLSGNNGVTIMKGGQDWVLVGSNPPGGQIRVAVQASTTLIANPVAANIPLSVQGAVSQTGNLTQWQNSSGTALALVDKNGYLAIGQSSAPNSPLQVNGAVATALATKTANYTVVATDSTILVDATGGARTITLPTAVGIPGREYRIKKVDSSANAVTVATTSSQKIDGVTTKALSTQYASVRVISDGANWFIL